MGIVNNTGEETETSKERREKIKIRGVGREVSKSFLTFKYNILLYSKIRSESDQVELTDLLKSFNKRISFLIKIWIMFTTKRHTSFVKFDIN